MPFSSQPRKKGSAGPQAGETLACGHSISAAQNACPTCAAKHKTGKVFDLNAEKKLIAEFQQKIAEKLRKEPKAAEKAAFILSNWLNQKRK